MTNLILGFIGDLQVGDCLFESRESEMTINFNGELITSGCAEAALVRSLGVAAVVRSLDVADLLDSFSEGDLIDYFINSNRSEEEIRNISQAINNSFN